LVDEVGDADFTKSCWYSMDGVAPMVKEQKIMGGG